MTIETFENKFNLFPGTRFMGSKNKIIEVIWELIKGYHFNSFFDAFAGSNVVAYFMKCQGKQVFTNDFMSMSYIMSKSIIENSKNEISHDEITFLLQNKNNQKFIQKKFKGLYFSDSENRFLDQIRFNIDLLDKEFSRSIALSALTRACMKKRPRGIFTYTGNRYDDGRLDIQKPLPEHFIENIELFNGAVFNNKTKCKSYNKLTEEIKIKSDVVYFDPPYFTKNSDNDYVRRYHFVEGLVKNWKGLEIQESTKTKKIRSYSTPFSKKDSCYSSFENLIKKYKESIIVISYSSNSFPTKMEMIEMMKKHKNSVIAHEIDHLYSFGNQNHKIGNNSNRVKEYLFIGS